jgi:hypothetical protein
VNCQGKKNHGGDNSVQLIVKSSHRFYRDQDLP